jgi:hypothetical protein
MLFYLQGPLVSLLGTLPDQTASIHSLLQNLESQARIMINRIGKEDREEKLVRKIKFESGLPQA